MSRSQMDILRMCDKWGKAATQRTLAYMRTEGKRDLDHLVARAPLAMYCDERYETQLRPVLELAKKG